MDIMPIVDDLDDGTGYRPFGNWCEHDDTYEADLPSGIVETCTHCGARRFMTAHGLTEWVE